MSKKKGIRAKHIDFIILDILACILSLVLSYYLRFGDFSFDQSADYRLMCVGTLLAYVFLMLFNNYHSGILRRGVLSELWHSLLLNVEILFFIVLY